jgi:hypothetical protein
VTFSLTGFLFIFQKGSRHCNNGRRGAAGFSMIQGSEGRS